MNETPNKSKGFFDGNPKMIFIFGIVSGIALMAIFGGGVNLPDVSAGNNGGSKTVREFNAPTPSAYGGGGGELAAVTDDDHVLGNLNKAKVVLVEYSDFECPFCGRHHPTMQQALDEFGDDVAWVYRHFPLSFHPEAVPSAAASECAAEQGNFWEFGDAMFENQQGLNDDYYFQVAEEIGLNMNKFTDCYESGKYLDDVTEDQQTGATAGVSGTPATFVNGTLVSGAVPYATIKDAIEQALAAE